MTVIAVSATALLISVNLRAIKNQEPLAVGSRVSKLALVKFERNPYPVLLKEPANFFDVVFIENEASVLDSVIHEGKPAPPLKPGHNLLRHTTEIIMACLEKNPDQRPTMERVAEVYAESAVLVK